MEKTVVQLSDGHVLSFPFEYSKFVGHDNGFNLLVKVSAKGLMFNLDEIKKSGRLVEWQSVLDYAKNYGLDLVKYIFINRSLILRGGYFETS